MSVKKILQEQMDACFTNKSWFTSLSDAVQGLNDEQADMKQGEEHSVRQVVTHLIFWNGRILKQLKGLNPDEFDRENSFTFKSESVNTDKLAWNDMTNMLVEILNSWKLELDSLTEEELIKEVPDVPETKAMTIVNTILHNAYHLGQIVSTRKQFNIWDSKLGV